MSFQPHLVVGGAAFRWRPKKRSRVLEQSKRSEQELPDSAFGRFTERLLLAFETLELTLRFFEFENLLFESGNMRIGAGQLRATRVQAALKFAHVRMQTRDGRFKS